MGRYLAIRLVLLISLLFFSAGCGYRFLGGESRSVRILPMENATSYPQFEIHMNRELRRLLNDSPGFILAEPGRKPDLEIIVNIKKAERNPLFYSRGEPPETVSSNLKADVEVTALRDGKTLLQESFSENLAFSVSVVYREEDVLRSFSEKMARRIYHWLTEQNEKGRF